MPKFKVLMQVDAFVDYVAEIEAASAQEAADIGYRDDLSVEWTKTGVHEYDARAVVTLDESGREIAETELGDFR